MKFRMSPYYIPLQIAGIILSAITILAWGILLLSDYPSSFSSYVFLISLSCVFLIAIILQMRKISFPWIIFSESGVQKKWILNVNTFISWRDCAEIGIILAQLGGGKHQGTLRWIYFSKTPLALSPIQAKKEQLLTRNDLILIEYYPHVLSEVLKYVPKNQIRNLHLLEQ